MKQLDDNKLKFNEEKHEYKIGKKKLTSVTTWIGQFFGEFDEDKITKKMTDKVVKEEDYESIEEFLSAWTAHKDGILASWKKARDDGTSVHKEIEDFINGDNDPLIELSAKAQQGIKYYDDEDNWVDFYTEVQIYSEELGLAGTIDLLEVNEPEHPYLKPRVKLVDWKTNKKISRQNPWQKTSKPLEHLHDSSYVKYNLQLSVYAYILESEYGYIIDGLELVHLKDDSYEVIKMDYLRETVKEMIKSKGDE